MNNTPLVSIIVNCFNGEKYLQKALNSILEQTYTNWEIIFWDNLSTDLSHKIFLTYNDSRFQYFKANNHTSLYEARNSAISKVNGDFIAFLDVDDWWERNKLELQVMKFDESKVGMVCSSYFLINERSNKTQKNYKGPFPSGELSEYLLNNYFVHFSTLVIRRDALKSLEYYCDNRFSIIGDFDLVLRLSIKGWLLECINTPLAFYRWHNRNTGFTSEYLISKELNIWVNEKNKLPEFSELPEFSILEKKSKWLMILKHLHDGERLLVLRSLGNVPKNKLFKVLVALFLPNFFLQKLLY